MTQHDRYAEARQRRARRNPSWARAARHGLVLLALGALAVSLTTAGGVAPAGARATKNKPPDRIISLSPTATEMLFAIGAGHQVVAVDDDSDYPPSAPRTSLSGLEPNIEALARYDPDLVVVSYDPQGFVKSLRALSVPVLLEPAAANLGGTYSQIESLGRVTGHEAAAGALVRRMRRQIAATVAAAPRFTTPPTYYFELEPDFYSVTSSTYVGQLFGLFGLHNVADAAQGASSGYPQLSDEYIVKSNPQVIFLADTICCHQSARTVAARPGWRAVAAVRDGDVVRLDDDIASRWGPRVVVLARDIEAALWRIKRHRQG